MNDTLYSILKHASQFMSINWDMYLFSKEKRTMYSVFFFIVNILRLSSYRQAYLFPRIIMWYTVLIINTRRYNNILHIGTYNWINRLDKNETYEIYLKN